jgi:Ca-activated chloride channel family protein
VIGMWKESWSGRCSSLSAARVVSCSRRLRIAVFTFGLVGTACGQALLDQPRIPSVVKPSSSRSSFRADANLVLVPVSVLDSRDRIVNGLQAGNFSISDNRLPQTIKYFSQEDAPISMTVVLDSSGSMATKIDQERAAALELLKDANPEDEFSLIAFGNEPRVAVPFSEPAEDVSKVVNSTQPDGYTSLWDAMYLALQQQKNSRYARKAIVVISDGGDNHSRYTEDEIKAVLQEADVQVYAIALSDRFVKTQEERLGPLRLDEITGVTGGRAIRIHDLAEITRAARDISSELRNKYVIGYYPTSHSTEGKWRTVKVQLTGLKGPHRLRVHARSGYYGPVD